MTEKPVVIVGGGVSGLSLGVMLLERGIPAVLVEKNESLGGLARSFRYDGYTFDVGPHRLHTNQEHVNDFIDHILGNRQVDIPRRSTVCFRRRYYPWPLHPSYVMLRFPPTIAASVVLDLATLYRKKPAANFKDRITNMYGKTLYKHFFEGYSAKFLKIDPELTHQDWASTGVDRAIIDSRVKMHSLWQLLYRSIVPDNKPETRFSYPAGGCGRFPDAMADRFRALGGEILTGRVPEGAAIEDGRVTEVHVEGRVIPTSYVAWTGTVHSLARLLDLPAPKVSYLALVCYYMTLSDGPPHDFQWSYHGTSDIIFSRISVPSNFDPANAPPGKRAICVEVSCYEGDEQYEHPERILDRLADDLVRERVLKSTEEIESVRFERFAWAYPVYHLDYRTELKRFDKSLASVKNVLRAGRLGKFWYNNMDHCVGAAFAHADKIAANLTGTPSKKEVAA